MLTKGAGLATAFAALPLVTVAADQVQKALGQEPHSGKEDPRTHCRAVHDRLNLVAGMTASYLGGSVAKKLLGTDVSQGSLLASEFVDTGATLGAMWMVHHTQQAPGDDKRSHLQGMLQKLGMKEPAAHCAAHSLTSFVLPETLGTGASLIYLLQSRHR